MAFNLVVLSGRLTSDVELKTTPSGVSVCSFTIANEIGYGENKKTAFINIVAWRQTAEFVSKYFNKGSMIGIEGSIQTRKYTDKEGKKRTAFEVVANNVQFMEFKSAEENNAGLHSNNSNISQNSNFNTNTTDFADIPDVDMPF